MFVFMVLMDLDGNISVETVFTAEYRDKYKGGINVQKKGFVGYLGSQNENRGDLNTELGGYDINIFERHDSDLSVNLKTEGAANLDTGVGIGVGVMCFGIMPAMAKGKVGLESVFSGSAEVTGSKKDGISWKADGEASMRAYFKANGLIKLKCKAKKSENSFGWENGFEREFPLADITLLEEKWKESLESPTELTYDDSYKKYYDYTKEQLENEFHSYEFVSGEVKTYSGEEKYYDIVYYDGDGTLPIKQVEADDVNGFYTWEVDYEHMDPSNTIIIQLTRSSSFNNGQWDEGNYDYNHKRIRMRLKKALHGITSKTVLGDLQNPFGRLYLFQGKAELVIDDDFPYYVMFDLEEYMAGFSLKVFHGSSDKLEIYKPEFVKDIDTAELRQILAEYNNGIGGLEEMENRLLDCLLDKILNKEAYIETYNIPGI